MGLGAEWATPTRSWREANYSRLCINSCWELYGAADRAHLPSSGAAFTISIEQAGNFRWVERWDEDEGAGKACPASRVAERHGGPDAAHRRPWQEIRWDISLPADIVV